MINETIIHINIRVIRPRTFKIATKDTNKFLKNIVLSVVVTSWFS